MKEHLKQFIRDQAEIGLHDYERIPELLAARDKARCVAQGVLHTCYVCRNYSDCLVAVQAHRAKLDAAKALLALL